MKKVSFMLFALLCALLLLDSAAAMQAAREGLFIWSAQVVPALFPFFVCTEMLQRLGGGRGNALPLFCMSMLSGAPSGARLCAAYDSLDSAKRTDLAAALNVAGPMYVYGAFCTGMLRLPQLALPILLAQYASAGVMLLFCRPFSLRMRVPETPVPGLRMLSEAIANGMLGMLCIGGAIVFFKVALGVAEAVWASVTPTLPPPAMHALLSGALEMVNGCALLAAAHLPPAQAAAIAAFLFSFGGVCVLAQSLNFTELQPLRYLGRKLIQGLLSAALAYLLTPLFLRAQAVFFPLDPQVFVQNTYSALTVFLASAIGMAVIGLLCALTQKPGDRSAVPRHKS